MLSFAFGTTQSPALCRDHTLKWQTALRDNRGTGYAPILKADQGKMTDLENPRFTTWGSPHLMQVATEINQENPIGSFV
jgi:hypothetical protein